MDWNITFGIGFLIIMSVCAKGFSKPGKPEMSDVSDDYEFSYRNPEVNPGMFEGDIQELPNPRAKNGIKATESHWPSGIIPYTITNAYKGAKVKDLEGAIAAITSDTKFNGKECITFRPAKENEVHLEIRFNMSEDSGCYATTVGFVKDKGNFINLAPRCSKGNMIHELLHAIGFWHEQSRPDRDDYINILWKNIVKRQHSQYEGKSTDKATTLNQPYDYGSIMHYPEFNSFSKKPYCLKTFQPTYPSYNIGQRAKLSKTDIRKLQILYKCRGPDPPFEGIKYEDTPFPSPIPDADICTFENDFCDWTQSENAILKWKRKKGMTQSSLTAWLVHFAGPLCAFYDENGYYIYADATRNENKVAKLTSKLYEAGNYCLEFDYHIFSNMTSGLGTLRVKFLDASGNTQKHLDYTRTKVEWWYHQRFHFTNGYDFHISFEARIKSYWCDIALDTLVYPGRCRN